MAISSLWMHNAVGIKCTFVVSDNTETSLSGAQILENKWQ